METVPFRAVFLPLHILMHNSPLSCLSKVNVDLSLLIIIANKLVWFWFILGKFHLCAFHFTFQIHFRTIQVHFSNILECKTSTFGPLRLIFGLMLVYYISGPFYFLRILKNLSLWFMLGSISYLGLSSVRLGLVFQKSDFFLPGLIWIIHLWLASSLLH